MIAIFYWNVLNIPGIILTIYTYHIGLFNVYYLYGVCFCLLSVFSLAFFSFSICYREIMSFNRRSCNSRRSTPYVRNNNALTASTHSTTSSSSSSSIDLYNKNNKDNKDNKDNKNNNHSHGRKKQQQNSLFDASHSILPSSNKFNPQPSSVLYPNRREHITRSRWLHHILTSENHNIMNKLLPSRNNNDKTTKNNNNNNNLNQQHNKYISTTTTTSILTSTCSTTSSSSSSSSSQHHINDDGEDLSAAAPRGTNNPSSSLPPMNFSSQIAEPSSTQQPIFRLGLNNNNNNNSLINMTIPPTSTTNPPPAYHNDNNNDDNDGMYIIGIIYV